MANLATAAIMTRLREVLDSAQGTLRTIASTRYDSHYYEGMPVDAQTMAALDRPIVDATITGVRRHSASPPIMGNVALLEIDVEVTCVRSATLDHKLDAAVRHTLKALAAEDADVIMQALTYPGNLTQTSAAVATGLCTGMLTYEGTEIDVLFEGDSSPRVVSTHRFQGVAQVAPAIS